MNKDTKRCRVPFSLDDETVNSHASVDHIDNDTVNNCTPTRHQSKQNRRPVHFPSKSSEQDASEESAIEFADTSLLGTSVVVYERGREGQIVKERSVRQGRGRPRKEYQVKWKSWVKSSNLLRDWKDKAHKHRH